MWSVSSGFGKLFFVAGFLPALAFLAAIDAFLVPHFLKDQHLIDPDWLGVTGVVYVVGGVFVGFLLLALNVPIVRLYENGLLLSRWLKRRNQERQRDRYTALTKFRGAYAQARNSGEDVTRAIAELEAVHQAIEKQHGRSQQLPYNVERVKPTNLGNIMAVTEDYAYERYGIDAMVYWPRMLDVIPKDYQTQIAELKTTQDFFLNFSVLAALFGLGALGVGAWFQSLPEIVYGALALILSYLLYRGSLGTARQMGEVVNGSFDLFRGALLEKYGLSPPGSIADERRQWLSLTSFIRRGEEFYYPAGAPQDD
jgi:hypothetical protein